jgi:spore coat polysaccharide biosynthesis protein SpsF
MLSLANRTVIEQVVSRVKTASTITDVVVATTDTTADDIVYRYGTRAGASVFRGSESDVLNRMYTAASRSNADIVVRITGDCPLISPDVVDEVVNCLVETGVDYCSNIQRRTFPRGLDVEAFTFESFETIHEVASEPHHREHVTPYYHENPEQFDHANICSNQVFDEPWMEDRGDLRFTLDEADDYEVLREIYENVPFEEILDVRDAVQYTDEHDLMSLNEDVAQKTV